VTPDNTYTVGPGTLSDIPAGVEYHSVNETDNLVKRVYTVLDGLYTFLLPILATQFSLRAGHRLVPCLMCLRDWNRLIAGDRIVIL
jgi:hypothetical protein